MQTNPDQPEEEKEAEENKRGFAQFELFFHRRLLLAEIGKGKNEGCRY
jgi:hypothetical protein